MVIRKRQMAAFTSGILEPHKCLVTTLGFFLDRKGIIHKGNLHTERRLRSVSKYTEHLQDEWKQVYNNYTGSWKQPGCLICSIFILHFSCICVKCSDTSSKAVTNQEFSLEKCIFLYLMKPSLSLSKLETEKYAVSFLGLVSPRKTSAIC